MLAARFADGSLLLAIVALIALVDSKRGERPLASALRVYALLRAMSEDSGPL